MEYSSRNYSYEKMKKSVALCMRVEDAEKKEKEMAYFLRTPIMSDEEYIDREVRSRFFSGNTVAVYIGLFILTLFLASCLFAYLTSMIPIRNLIENMLLSESGVTMLLFFGIGFLVLWFIGITRLILTYHHRKVTHSEYFANYRERRDHIVQNKEELLEQHRQMQMELEELRRKLQNPVYCIIPPDYQRVAPVLLKYIRDGRSENLKQAMDRYDKEQREALNTELLRQAAEEARKAAQDAAEALENSEQAASDAREALWNSILR